MFLIQNEEEHCNQHLKLFVLWAHSGHSGSYSVNQQQTLYHGDFSLGLSTHGQKDEVYKPQVELLAEGWRAQTSASYWPHSETGWVGLRWSYEVVGICLGALLRFSFLPAPYSCFLLSISLPGAQNFHASPTFSHLKMNLFYITTDFKISLLLLTGEFGRNRANRNGWWNFSTENPLEMVNFPF